MKRVILIGLVLLIAASAIGQTLNVDSLLNEFNLRKEKPEEQLDICYKICSSYFKYDMGKSMEYAEIGLNLAQKVNDKKHICKFAGTIANIYLQRGEYDTSLKWHEKTLSYAVELNDKSMEASIYSDIGVYYALQEKFTEALDNWLKALSILENLENKPVMIQIMNNMAMTYRNMDNYERALYYLEKAKNLVEETDNNYLKMTVYLELGAFFYEQAVKRDPNKFEIALEHFVKANELSKELHQVRYQASSTHALSEIYAHYLQDYKKALNYALESLNLAQQFGDPKMIYAAYGSISRSYYFLKQYPESVEASMKAFEMDSTDFNVGANILSNLILSHSAMCNQDEVIRYFAKLKELTDKHIDRNNQEIMADMETKYETEKKTLRITSLERERKLYVWLGLVGLISLFALGLALWLSKRNARKEKQLIATRSIIDGEMKERTRLARDLHDRLSGNLTAVKIELSKQAQSLYAVIDQLDVCIDDIRNAAHDMMPASLQFGIKVALEDFAAKFTNVHFHFFGQEKRISKRIEYVLYCCATELVNNAIKHANATSIHMQLVINDQYATLSVSDDGCGFDPKTAKKGLGIKSISDRVAFCNGFIDFNSSPGHGTETTIELRTDND